MSKFSYKSLFTILFFLLIGIIILAKFVLPKNKVSAAWWNESWNYRQAINISSHTTAQSNVFITTSINISSTSKAQTNDGDFRFISQSGDSLSYYIVSGSGTANITFHIQIPIFPAGPQTIYAYYGNPSASNGFSSADFSTQASNYTIGSLSAEEAGGGPIAYWKFDEGVGTSVYDSSGNNHQGTTQSGATWQTEDQCVSGKCLKFNGPNGYVSVGIASNYFPLPTFTTCAWIKTPGLGTSMTSNGVLSLAYGLVMGVDSSGHFVSRMNDGSGEVDKTISSINLYDNQWHQLCLNYDGVNRNMYIDGANKLSSGGTWSGNTSWPTNNCQVGNDVNNSMYKFNGLIDDVKIYQYARTAAQIKLDYNSRGSVSASSTNLGTNKNNNSLSNGLVGYWKMDEGTGTTTADSSGNSISGTLSGGATWSSGKYGSSAIFAGGTQSVIVSNSSTLGLTNNFTISAWVNPQEISSSIYKVIVGKANDWTNGYALGTTDGIFKFLVANGVDFTMVNDSTTYTINNWYCLTATYNNSILSFYVNGVLKEQKTVSTITSSSNSFYIGGLNNSSSRGFSSKIDEVRVYNRALSPTEVTQLYEYAPGPITYYDFNENTGTVANDKSGNNKNGTLQNSPSWIPGKISSALDFKTSGQRVLINSPTPLTGQATATLWYKRTSTASTTWRTLLGDATANVHPLISQNTTRNLGIWDGSFKDFGYPPPDDNQFHHYTVVYDIGSSATLYVDGIYKNKIYTTLNLTTNPIGAIGNYSSGSYWAGAIDDVKIYNYARTQKQIIEDMTAGAPASSKKSPIIYYKFDEGNGTITNNSGIGGSSLNSTFATGNSAPTWTNDGKFGKSLNFNNTYSYTRVSTSILNPSPQFTATVWVKSNDTSQDQTILSANAPFFLRIRSGKFRVGIHTNSSWSFINGSIPLNNNTWYHLSLVYDGINIKSYVNGQLDITSAKTGPLVSFSPIFVGYSTTTGENYPFNGLIDEVKIYNYALTAEEIKQDYNQNSAIQMGSTNQTIGATTTSLDYCIPGDTTFCTSPVLEYNFEENTGTIVKDTSGNNNTGTFGTGSSAPTWTTGQNGSAINFDGVNDIVNIGTPSILDFGSNSFSYSLWVNVPSSAGAYDMPFYKGGGSAGNAGFDMELGTGGWGAGLSDGSTVKFGGFGNETLNQWVFLSVVVDRTNNKFFTYKNGTLIGTVDITGFGSVTSANSAVLSSSSQKFKGKIDNIRFYNYARTPAQIAYDYNKGTPSGWWKFDECQGNIANNSVGIGNSGSINIGPSGIQNSLGTCQVGTSATWTAGASGKINSSLNFDGQDDFMTAPITISGSEATVSFWVKNPARGVGTYIFRSNANSRTYMNIDSSGSQISFIKGDPAVGLGGGNIIANSWNHVVLKWWTDSTSTLHTQGFINNQPIGVGKTFFNNSSGSYISVASISNTGSSFTSGQFDDVRVYNYALTNEQIKTLYNGGGVSFN